MPHVFLLEVCVVLYLQVCRFFSFISTLKIKRGFFIKVVCCMQCCFSARYRSYHLTLYHAEEVFLTVNGVR